MKKLLIATNNSGKLLEIEKILDGIPYVVQSLKDYPLCEEPTEDGATYEENATAKAKYYSKLYMVMTIADDSGLEIDALKGRPGVYSARYVAGSDKDRIEAVLKELHNVPKERRTARFIACIALYDPYSDVTLTFFGRSEGRLLEGSIGENGFGYDPIFYNNDLGKTNAQATSEEKNLVSHRARALYKLKSFLLKRTG